MKEAIISIVAVPLVLGVSWWIGMWLGHRARAQDRSEAMTDLARLDADLIVEGD